MSPNSFAARIQQTTLQCLFWPAVRWAVRSGVGYTQVAKWLKPLFLHEAQALLQSQSRKVSSSALVLVSGLHRSDIKSLMLRGSARSDDAQEAFAISLSQQVLAQWMISGWPSSIPYKTAEVAGASYPAQVQPPEPSFYGLIQNLPKVAAQGMSARLLLQDMCRSGLLQYADGMVTLAPIGTTPVDNDEYHTALEHLKEALSDLMAVGVHNLGASADQRHLEQSLLVDGLWPESVERLHELAQDEWQKTMTALLPQAKAASDHDEPLGGTMRVRLGIYFHAEPMALIPTTVVQPAAVANASFFNSPNA